MASTGTSLAGATHDPVTVVTSLVEGGAFEDPTSHGPRSGKHLEVHVGGTDDYIGHVLGRVRFRLNATSARRDHRNSWNNRWDVSRSATLQIEQSFDIVVMCAQGCVRRQPRTPPRPFWSRAEAARQEGSLRAIHSSSRSVTVRPSRVPDAADLELRGHMFRVSLATVHCAAHRCMTRPVSSRRVNARTSHSPGRRSRIEATAVDQASMGMTVEILPAGSIPTGSDHGMCSPEMLRATTSRWISEVPSKIV